MTQNPFQELYKQIVMSHYQKETYLGVIENCRCSVHGQNRMCGDEITIYLQYESFLKDIKYTIDGCAILKASAVLMAELTLEKSFEEIVFLYQEFSELIEGKKEYSPHLDKLNIFAGLHKFSSRSKCAILPWETLLKGILTPVK